MERPPDGKAIGLWKVSLLCNPLAFSVQFPVCVLLLVLGLVLLVCACLGAQSCPTFWTVAHQAPLSVGFFRQEYWSGLPFLPPEDLPHPGIKPESPVSLALQTDSLPTELSGKSSHLESGS